MKIQLSCLGFITLSVISGCTKNYSNAPAQYTDLQSALSKAATKVTTVSFDAGSGSSFADSSGTRYIIPPNAFATNNGQVVTGKVTVSAISFLKRSDVLFSKALTVSNGQPLASAGEFYFKVTQNGADLKIADGQMYSVKMPQTGPCDTSMQLYFGTLLDTNVNKTSIVNWQPASGTSMGFITNPAPDTTVVTTNQTGYVNSDQPLPKKLPKGIYQSFTLRLTSVDGMSNIVSAYAIYDSVNVVWPMLNVKDGYVTEDHVLNVPCRFVVFAIIKGNFYAAVTKQVPMTGIIYGVDVARTTPSALKALIDNY